MYMRMGFDIMLAGDMFLWKIDVVFKDLPKVFGIADDILIVGYDADGKEHNRMPRWVMQICNKEHLNLNKDKCHFRYMIVPFRKVISKHSIQPYLCKLHVFTDMPTPTNKNKINAF